MPRPKTKHELIKLSNGNFFQLIDFIHSLPEDKKKAEFPPSYLNRNIRDVIAHLHHWHLMMLEWYQLGMQGTKPDIPAKGYTWKTLPDLNHEVHKKYLNTDLSEAVTMLHSSFGELQKIIEKHTDEELFEKKRYNWTGSTSLGAYLISATSSHYDWALNPNFSQ